MKNCIPLFYVDVLVLRGWYMSKSRCWFSWPLQVKLTQCHEWDVMHEWRLVECCLTVKCSKREIVKFALSSLSLNIRIVINVWDESCTLTSMTANSVWHDDVIKWKHFRRYRPFERRIHRSPMNSPYKGQWRGALVSSLICTWINGWVNNGEAGILRRHRAHYDVIVMGHDVFR